ncbi:MAG: hypothetical protein HY561_09810 [Gemmatimonadetes bacterium]|nr:hypothetical protein [Gemmatimonadota bacterium]
MWRRICADGCEWEVRVLPRESPAGLEILEFRALDGLRPPRRLAVPLGLLERMDELALAVAYRQARPIGGDYYGRPGKRMPDVIGP